MLKNFLFIGVEPNFMAYFFTKETVSSSSTDSCQTVAQAKNKLATSLYDVYIVDDAAGSPSEVRDLIQNIRNTSPNGIIVAIGMPGLEFKEGLVNAVLDKPLSPQQVDALCYGLFSRNHSVKDLPFLVAPSAKLPMMFVVDPDRTFLDLLHKVNKKFSFNLQSISDPKEAFVMLKELSPDALVVAESFPGYSLSGCDIIDAENHKREQPFISALILDQGNEKGNIASRIKAMEHHIHYVFHKPIYAYTFLQSMKEALEAQLRQNYKVLILDDDEEFCHIAEEILKDAGIEVWTIHTAEDLFATLDNKKPDLLLLDLRLPQYDGLNLLKTLRQDVAYSHLGIVIITGADESSTKLSAYSAKADEIIYKPIDPLLFQKRILHFVEQKSRGRHREEITGMGSLKELISKIHSCLENEGRMHFSMALFEINRLDQWIQLHGISQAEELLISIGNALLLETDKKVDCFNYEKSRYILIFEKTTPQEAATMMEVLLSHLAKRESRAEIGFNCSIIELSKKYGNAEKNLKAVEKNLIEARKKDTALIKMSVETDNGKHNKEVVLIDEDQQLTRILKKNFESHGVEVSIFSDGKAALANLLNREERELPSLIILERKLDAMDGIDIIIQTKEHFHRPIPFFILTFYGSDKDVIEGIKEGAQEYMTKPFNTSILMEKALKTIFQK